MTVPQRLRPIELIPIEQITVLNPRSRNKRQHREIVDNIKAIGLKRPITVRRRADSDKPAYDLVCGEGRLDAFRMLGEHEIPAVIVDATESDCLVMSLVENIARRQHRPIDLMQEIGSLHRRGYNDGEIARKIGCSTSWINMIVALVERGEERLLSAVETGLIPVNLAIDIARAESDDAQDILMDAFEAGKVKSRNVGAIRRMLDRRMKHQKRIGDSGLGRHSESHRMTAADLLRLYQREADKRRILVKKADFTQARLLFIVEALKDLLTDDGFVTLLRAEAHRDDAPGVGRAHRRRHRAMSRRPVSRNQGVKLSFEREGVILGITQLVPLKMLRVGIKGSKKYRQILSSVRAIGLVEVPVVAPDPEHPGRYFLLDGHLRIEALKELGVDDVQCLVSADDEAYARARPGPRFRSAMVHQRRATIDLSAGERRVSGTGS